MNQEDSEQDEVDGIKKEAALLSLALSLRVKFLVNSPEHLRATQTMT